MKQMFPPYTLTPYKSKRMAMKLLDKIAVINLSMIPNKDQKRINELGRKCFKLIVDETDYFITNNFRLSLVHKYYYKQMKKGN